MNGRNRLDQLKDQLTLWMLLYKLKEAGFQTQRLKLQKLMYLIDIFGSIVDVKPTNYTFVVYKHGPYTKQIQSDVEHLVAKGLVHVEETKRWDPSHERSFKYQIERGSIEQAKKLLPLVNLEKNEEIIEFVIQVAGYLSSSSIQSLVYAEPNFTEAKKYSKEKKCRRALPIDSDYPFVQRFKKISSEVYLDEYGVLPSDELVSWFYLNFVQSIEKPLENNQSNRAVDK